MDKLGFIEFMKSQKDWVSNDNNEFRIFHDTLKAPEGAWYDSYESSSYVLVDDIIFGYTETEDGYDEGNCPNCKQGTMKELSIYDDMDGMLTCDKCGVRVKV